jgi:AbrB family looped-hinge helix DNA binding protein
MAVATLTSKGQITIPKEIRNQLKLHSGDQVDFRLTAQGEVMLKPLTRRVDEVFGRLSKLGQKVIAPEEMDAAIAKRIKHTS